MTETPEWCPTCGAVSRDMWGPRCRCAQIRDMWHDAPVQPAPPTEEDRIRKMLDEAGINSGQDDDTAQEIALDVALTLLQQERAKRQPAPGGFEEALRRECTENDDHDPPPCPKCARLRAAHAKEVERARLAGREEIENEHRQSAS